MHTIKLVEKLITLVNNVWKIRPKIESCLFLVILYLHEGEDDEASNLHSVI